MIYLKNYILTLFSLFLEENLAQSQLFFLLNAHELKANINKINKSWYVCIFIFNECVSLSANI